MKHGVTSAIVGIAAVSLIVASSATAATKTAFRCSETGDVCVGLELRENGSLVIFNQYAARYGRALDVCFAAPGKSERCLPRRLKKTGTAYRASIVVPSPAPGRWRVGSGLSATLRVPGRTRSETALKRCTGSRFVGASRIEVRYVKGPISCAVAKSVAQKAVAERVESGFPTRFCTGGWCFNWGEFRGVTEGLSVASFSGFRGRASFAARQFVS